ncbi:uncharacterized protein AB675_8492 [Cyphellophora attinorum]|uniref:Transcription factor domain-containing protein n=1 Tax=Cyphellophora attinorum TaxID=1664694 RepID=A0A0N0NRA6_9EURO|nr:uncharacterized protein AB675_8492 [Phialophora attinorum]KPI44609.1 hypothetical protein AB675_8492 [Phialophora attinorum]
MGKGPTKNILNPQFVFVNKDANSKSLTSSEGPEKQTIYGHVRRHMVKPALKEEAAFDQTYTPSKPNGVRNRTRKNVRHDKRSQKAVVRRRVVENSDPSEDVPEAQTPDTITPDSPNGIAPPTIIRELDTNRYARSYDYFQQMIIAESTGFHDQKFWRASLQMSNSHEAVFHALTSLGAYYESLTSIEPTNRMVARVTSHEHYAQAVGAIYKASYEVDSKLRLPLHLIAFVVIATIEIFNNADLAYNTLQHALRYAHEQSQLKFTNSEMQVLMMATDMMKRYMNRLTLVLGPMSVVKDRSESDSSDEIPLVPCSFDSLLQAKACLQIICDWSFRRKKDVAFIPSVDVLQHQWLSAVDMFSRNSGLHPLSTRSLNLLKISRLASACLLAAHYLSGASDYDACFTIFRELLNIYRGDFSMSGSRTIFLKVFDIHDNVADIVDRAKRDGIAVVQQAAYAPRPPEGENWSDFFFGNSAGETNGGSSRPRLPRLQIHGLDFYARTGQVHVRLKQDGQDEITNWKFSLVDPTYDASTPGP